MVISFIVCFILFIPNFHGEIRHRLPTSIFPLKYVLNLETHLNDPPTPFKFSGNVEIILYCNEDTRKIVLHVKGLNVSKSKTKVFHHKPRLEISVLYQNLNKQNDFYIITLTKNLRKHETYTLVMHFEGVLSRDMSGYYRSSYSENNVTKWMSVTQFEAVEARTAFPCFDEPSFKAVFKIILTHHKKYSSMSNMPLFQQISLENNQVRSEFLPTFLMSTYLVAFSINELVAITSKQEAVQFRIWTKKSSSEQATFASEVAPKALKFFEWFFGIKYPLSKVDMVAIPDFSAGAMENWGLINYREESLLYDRNLSSQRNKDRVFTTIVHELAHQWFGNLVTMKWWTDLWLNEGFSSYMEMVASKYIFPEWTSEKIYNVLLGVYSSDSLESSHQISVPIKATQEIDEIFDEISYAKGSMIVRMMSFFLGENVFRKGLHRHLNTYAFSNADQNDLWNSLTVEAYRYKVIPKQFSVKTIMDTWTLQPGYPIITITRNCPKSRIRISQKRFLVSGDKTDESCWWVPVTYTLGANFNETAPKIWLSCRKPIRVKKIDCSKWIIGNIQGSGLYSVNYDKGNWLMLIHEMLGRNFQEIPEIHRAMLVDNSLRLARAGQLSYKIAFKLLSYLKQEDAYLPWLAALESLKYIELLLRRTPLYETFKDYTRNLLTPIYKKLGGLSFTSVGEEVTKFRAMVVQNACRLNIPHCVTQALMMFQHIQDNHTDAISKISSNFLRPIYCSGLRYGGDEKRWNFLWSKYLKTEFVSEKTNLMVSLGCINDTTILNKYLAMTVDKSSKIRPQNIPTVFTVVALREVGFQVAKQFLEERIGEISEIIGSEADYLKSLLFDIGDQITTEEEKYSFFAFLEKNKKYFKGINRAIRQVQEKILLNTMWSKKYLKVVEESLKINM